MKVGKILILLAVISYVFDMRVDRKVSSKKFKWQDSYDCKLSLNEQEQGQGKFTPQSVQNPNSAEEKLGWIFDMSNGPQDNLKKHMVQIGNSQKWYIPYRYMTGEVTLINGTKNNKFMLFKVSADGNPIITNTLKVGLPFKAFGWYINDAEAGQLTNLINELRQKNQQLLSNAKQELSNSVNKYIDDLAAVAASKQGDQALADLLAKIKSNIDNLQKEIDSVGAQIESSEKEISQLESDLQNKQNNYNDQNSKLVQLQATITDGQTSLDSIKKNTGNAASNVSNLKNSVAIANSDFISHIEKLKKLCPNISNAAEDARNSAASNDKGGMAKNINRIYA